MAKGGKLPEIKLAKTQIGEFDEFFQEAKDPLATIIGWNNDLSANTTEFRKIGSDIRKDSEAGAPPAIGELKLSVDDAGFLQLAVEKEGAELKKFDKVTNEFVKAVQAKVKKVNGRLTALRKKEGFADAKYGINNKGDVVLVADEAKVEEAADEDFMIAFKRSLLKLNDRKSLLDLQLKGPVTLAEAVSGFINSLKKELEKKAKSISIAISESGLPTLEGIPDDLEDFLPSLLVRAYKLFMQLIDFVKKIIEELPDMQPKIEALVEKAKEFPSKASSAASSAGLSGMQIPKAIKATGNNVKALGTAPGILKQLGDTVKDTSLQLADAATGNKADSAN